MSSTAQQAANLANAQSSTGPVTEAGKARSSKNAVVHGLYSGDFVRPGDEQSYSELCAAMIAEFAPATIMEEILVQEIRRAVWRLRRCGEVEFHLVIRLDDGENFIFDPMETIDERAEKIQKSVDRARSQAHRLLHKATAELCKLQNERRERCEAAATTPPIPINAPITTRTQSQPAATPRNASCPCHSGLKYKRCCGKSAPAVLCAV